MNSLSGAKSAQFRSAFPWLNAGVLDKARAEELADGLDLDRVTYCAACVFELAWAIHTGHAPHWQTVARVADWTWAELEESLFAALVDARNAGGALLRGGLAPSP